MNPSDMIGKWFVEKGCGISACRTEEAPTVRRRQDMNLKWYHKWYQSKLGKFVSPVKSNGGDRDRTDGLCLAKYDTYFSTVLRSLVTIPQVLNYQSSTIGYCLDSMLSIWQELAGNDNNRHESGITSGISLGGKWTQWTIGEPQWILRTLRISSTTLQDIRKPLYLQAFLNIPQNRQMDKYGHISPPWAIDIGKI